MTRLRLTCFTCLALVGIVSLTVACSGGGGSLTGSPVSDGGSSSSRSLLNVLRQPTATVNCTGYSVPLEVDDLMPGTTYTVDYTFTLPDLRFTADGLVKHHLYHPQSVYREEPRPRRERERPGDDCGHLAHQPPER